jgi:hypothetical protein
MYMVYWSQNVTGTVEAQSESFGQNEMSAALKFMEDLRKRQHAGEGIAFVTMSSENPNCVGKMGASDVEPGYNWTKRRSTALRKDTTE